MVVGLAVMPIVVSRRTAVAPPGVATLLLVISLRIIVLLPLGFLSRASTVLRLTSYALATKGINVDQC